MTEDLTPALLIHLLQLLQVEREECRRGQEIRCGVRGGFTVPGTNLLTDVTTVDIVPQVGQDIGRNFSFVLNGLVGNAVARVHAIGSVDGTGGTGTQTAGAVATALRNRLVVIEFHVDDQLPQEEVGTLTGNDQQGVLADKTPPVPPRNVPAPGPSR